MKTELEIFKEEANKNGALWCIIEEYKNIGLYKFAGKYMDTDAVFMVFKDGKRIFTSLSLGGATSKYYFEAVKLMRGE